MYSPFHEVTSKIAFAIAKLESIATAALALLVVGAMLLVSELDSLPEVIADLAVVATSGVVLGYAFTRSNLESVNRPALRLLNLGGGAKIVAMVTAWLFFRSASSFFATDLGLVLAIVAITVAYPLPIRRGSTVLYEPGAVRVLSDGRSRALASGVVLALALPAALPIGLPSGGSSGWLTLRTGAALFVVCGAAGLGLWSGLPPGSRRSRAMVGPLAAALVVGVVAAAGSAGVGAVVVAGGVVAAAAAGLAVPPLLGSRLTRDKTIVSRRG